MKAYTPSQRLPRRCLPCCQRARKKRSLAAHVCPSGQFQGATFSIREDRQLSTIPPRFFSRRAGCPLPFSSALILDARPAPGIHQKRNNFPTPPSPLPLSPPAIPGSHIRPGEAQHSPSRKLLCRYRKTLKNNDLGHGSPFRAPISRNIFPMVPPAGGCCLSVSPRSGPVPRVQQLLPGLSQAPLFLPQLQAHKPDTTTSQADGAGPLSAEAWLPIDRCHGLAYRLHAWCPQAVFTNKSVRSERHGVALQSRPPASAAP